MSAPFFEYGLFGAGFSLVVALIVGIAFGWCLERSGMGSARKLMGQFYLTDLTVFKVMFSAMITAMLGIFWLGWLGFLDVARIYVPETYILPQLVGGVIFGVGFATAGLCPGTSCVSAVTGRGDGVAAVLGMLSGVLIAGVFFGLITSAVPYAMARGTRDFSSTMQLVAGRYDVLCDPQSAERARDMLARLKI